MIEISVALVVLGGMALFGYLRWLDRVHPASTQQGSVSEDWEQKFRALTEQVEALQLGSKLRSRRNEEEL